MRREVALWRWNSRSSFALIPGIGRKISSDPRSSELDSVSVRFPTTILCKGTVDFEYRQEIFSDVIGS